MEREEKRFEQFRQLRKEIRCVSRKILHGHEAGNDGSAKDLPTERRLACSLLYPCPPLTFAASDGVSEAVPFRVRDCSALGGHAGHTIAAGVVGLRREVDCITSDCPEAIAWSCFSSFVRSTAYMPPRGPSNPTFQAASF